LTDEELLEQAAAENRAARAKEIADGCPTKAELLAALDHVTLFDLRVVEDGKATQTCLSPAGDYVFFTDVNDAAEALQARKRTHPGHLVLGTTPLGRAFGLTEGKAFGFQTNVQFPMRLQGSTEVLNDLVRDGHADGAKALCPAHLRKQLNPRSTVIPMFSLSELVEGTEAAPYFFTKADAVQYWMAATGKPQEALDGTHLILTDLRVLVIRMMSEPQDWKVLRIVPSASTVHFLQGAAASREQAQSAAPPAAAAPEASISDEPPPLAADDEPPPLE